MAKNSNSKSWNKKHPLVKLKRRIRLSYLKILRLDDPPDRIARGAAIGVLMGILPTFGIGGLMAIGLAYILKANKAASVFGSFIMNPLTMPFFFSSSVLLGSAIFREDSATILAKFHEASIINSLGWTTVVYMTGNIVISAVFTIASYYIVKDIIIRHRKKKAARRLARVQAEMAEHARLHPTHHHELHNDTHKDPQPPANS